jgi:hypothetical protein
MNPVHTHSIFEFKGLALPGGTLVEASLTCKLPKQFEDVLLKIRERFKAHGAELENNGQIKACSGASGCSPVCVKLLEEIFRQTFGLQAGNWTITVDYLSGLCLTSLPLH